jgi:hypothetical protein
VHGRVRLTCDRCGRHFERRYRDALAQLARNDGGRIYCSPACAAKATNCLRGSRTAAELSLTSIVRALILGGRSNGGGLVSRLTEPEHDMFWLLIALSRDLQDHAPPEFGEWDPESRVIWERADATTSAVLFLLDREIERRDVYSRAILKKPP